jgi:hypothetical protein
VPPSDGRSDKGLDVLHAALFVLMMRIFATPMDRGQFWPVAPLTTVIGVCYAEAEAARGAGGLAVVVAAGVVVLWPQPQPSSRVTRENFDRIHDGMSRAEVEAILGPRGDYRTRLGESELSDQSWNPDLADYGQRT